LQAPVEFDSLRQLFGDDISNVLTLPKFFYTVAQ